MDQVWTWVPGVLTSPGSRMSVSMEEQGDFAKVKARAIATACLGKGEENRAHIARDFKLISRVNPI